MNRTRSLLIIAWLVLCPWGQRGALADSGTPPRIEEVQVGLGGVFKVGYWTPVKLHLHGGDAGFSGQVEFTAPDNDDVTARLVPCDDTLLEIPPSGEWIGWRYVKVGRLRSAVRVGLRDRDGHLVAEQTLSALTPQPATCPWVVTAGRDLQVEQAGVFLARMREERLLSSRLTDVADFPDRWYGYEGVSVLLVPTGEASPLESLSQEQFAALDHWLRMGGRMLLTAGRRAEELFGAEHRFHAFRPGTLIELDSYWKASGLEAFARAAERLQSDGTAPLAVFGDLQGTVICHEGAGGIDDRALVMQSPYGFGEITYVALDIDLPPLADWPARPRLLARLLQTRGEEEDTAAGDQRVGQVTHVGFEDLSGQLRAALDQFPGVTLVQFSWVAGLLVAYVLLIGPLDFFGLRWLQRPQWTWITFPLLVLLFGVVSIWLFGRWKGTRPQINQAEIVDIDVVGQLVRGTTWAQIYSPQSTRLGVDIEPRPTWPSSSPDTSAQPTPRALTSWQGLPGSGWGGMTNNATVDVLSDEYRLRYPLRALGEASADSPQLDGLPIQTASSKGIIARWSAATDVPTSSDLTADRNHLLRGTVSNCLDVELTHCRLYYQNWAYPLEGTLAPGATAKVGSGTPLDLRWRLTRRSVVGTQEVRSYWRSDDVSDLDRILEVLMFYGAAGGRSYTGLTHNYQGFVDLSRHLRSGRAILVGRSAQPASHVALRAASRANEQAESVATEQQHWCYYRIVLPVQRARDAATD